MNKPLILSPFWEQVSKDKSIDFYPTPEDSTHFIVSRPTEDGSETIGHVYVEINGDEFRYISTNKKGKEIFQPTTDFNLVEMQFERYAQLLALHQRGREVNKLYKTHNYQLNHINNKTMKTKTRSAFAKTQRLNQFRFIEYEKPAKDGHFVTVGDSYHNLIARIHKIYNEEDKKYEYVAYDHAGNQMAKSDKLWEVKKVFTDNRDPLLEQAHQRRIASKQQSVNADKQQLIQADERKSELQKFREDKSDKGLQSEKASNQENEKNSREEEREQELENIRDSHDDRGEANIER